MTDYVVLCSKCHPDGIETSLFVNCTRCGNREKGRMIYLNTDQTSELNIMIEKDPTMDIHDIIDTIVKGVQK